MGFKDIEDPVAFGILEKHLYKWKEQYSSRLAYGGLYGCLKTNAASHKAISFFEEEVMRTIDSISK